MCLFLALSILPVHGLTPSRRELKERIPPELLADGMGLQGIDGWRLEEAVAGGEGDDATYGLIWGQCSCDFRSLWGEQDPRGAAFVAYIEELVLAYGGVALLGHWARGMVAREEVPVRETRRLRADGLRAELSELECEVRYVATLA